MRKILVFVSLICCFIVFASCSGGLNAAQKEIKAKYESQMEQSLKEYDEKIRILEDLKDEVDKTESLEAKKQMIINAGVADEDSLSAYTSARIDEFLKEEIEFAKNTKESFKTTYTKQMEDAISNAG